MIPSGLRVEQESYPGILSFQLNAAVQDAVSLAHAGLIAAAFPNTVPFSYFFSSDLVTVRLNTVASVLARVAAVNGPETLDVFLSCTDHRNICGSADSFELCREARASFVFPVCRSEFRLLA